MCGLWVKQNIEGKIVDRMVIKQVTTTPYKYRGLDRTQDHWHSGYRLKSLTSSHTDFIGTLPQEAFNQKTLCLNNVPHVVGYRAWAKEGDNLRWRLYMDYCEAGDLDDLVKGRRT